MPESEIEFIHDADTEVKKKELFSRVRKGDVRVLLGSTPKMGAGTNVQRLLYASHDLDCPWRPADLEQRAGRIIRQGNTNPDVHIRRYVTKDTFQAKLERLAVVDALLNMDKHEREGADLGEPDEDMEALDKSKKEMER